VWRPLAVALIAIAALNGAARVRAVVRPEAILWIAAHPDDEAVAAPLLARLCANEGARCGFLILTRGESGTCLRPEGCLPDLATVRSAEAAAAAELFHAELILLRYPNGDGASLPVWPDAIPTVAARIEAFHPDVIVTFDPRHGTTCHPEHRETGRIVIEALGQLTFAPALYLLETRVAISSDPFAIHFSSATPLALRIDSTAAEWNAIVADMQRHPSQFNEQWTAAIDRVPQAERAVFIAPAGEILGDIVVTCP
jgi:LmbE family N-acetylglucosaminyl deacetylase